MSPTEAAKYLGIKPEWLLVLRHRGVIKDFYPGGRPQPNEGNVGRRMVRIAKSELDRFIREEGINLSQDKQQDG